MPFTAKDINSQQIIDISKIDNPRDVLKRGDIVCPVCNREMIIRGGSVFRRIHFSHKINSGLKTEFCEYAAYSNGETQEHRDCKQFLRDNYKTFFPEWQSATALLEKYIPNTMHARNRIADVFLEFNSGWGIALEVQLAAITSEELEERTQDYEEQGINCFWWLGKNAFNQRNKEWSLNRYGFYLQIEIATASEPTKFMVHSKQNSYNHQGIGNLSNV